MQPPPCRSLSSVKSWRPPGPKGLDIGGTLAKIVLALPAGTEAEHLYPEKFGLTGRTRYDLEFDFELGDGPAHRLRFVSGATGQIEEAIASTSARQTVGRTEESVEDSGSESLHSSEAVLIEDSESDAGPSRGFEIRASPTPPTATSSGIGGAEADSEADTACSDELENGTRAGVAALPPKVFTAGGGAHKFAPLFRDALGVELVPVKELSAVVDGLSFLARHGPRERCLYAVGEGGEPERLPWPEPLFPLLLVNMGTGVSILRVDSEKEGDYARVGGTACGGGTFLGLARALTSAETFAEALLLAEAGDAAKCDLLVSDIYGEEGSASLGLPGKLTASNFGRLGDPSSCLDQDGEAACREQDVARALLQMVTQQSALLSGALARQSGTLDRIFFVGGFIDEENRLARASIAANFRNLGGQAYFVQHSDYLGALGSLRSCLSEEVQTGE